MGRGGYNGKGPNSKQFRVFPILAPRPLLSGQIKPPSPHHVKYTIMGGYNGKDPQFPLIHLFALFSKTSSCYYTRSSCNNKQDFVLRVAAILQCRSNCSIFFQTKDKIQITHAFVIIIMARIQLHFEVLTIKIKITHN